MEGILKKVDSLASELEKKLQEVNAGIAQNETDAKANKELKASLKLKEQELTGREAAIKKIEDVVTLHDEGVRLRSEAKKEREQLLRDKEANQKWLNEQKQDIAKQKEAIAIANAKTLDDKKLVKREWDDLNKAKDGMRQEMVDELLQNAIRAAGNDQKKDTKKK